MTDAPKDNRRALDVVLAGYLLDAEMLKYLCIASYGATAAELKTRSPVDFASCYYNERDVLDAPWLVPVRYYSKSNPDEPEQRWVLPGRAAFFVADTEPPKLPFDQETKTYLNAWFPPRLLKMPAFEGIRYYQTYWPRGWPGVSSICVFHSNASPSLTHANHVNSDRYRPYEVEDEKQGVSYCTREAPAEIRRLP